MTYSIVPVVDIDVLERAIDTQYDVDLDLRELLYGEECINNCCKWFYYDELEIYEGKSWQDPDHIAQTNMVKTYLQDTIPGRSCVLLDISW